MYAARTPHARLMLDVCPANAQRTGAARARRTRSAGTPHMHAAVHSAGACTWDQTARLEDQPLN